MPRQQNPGEIFKDAQTAGQAVASEEFQDLKGVLQGKVNARASPRKPPSSLRARGRREGEIPIVVAEWGEGEERRPRAPPQPPPVRGSRSCQHIPGRPGAPAPQGHREAATLHNLPPRRPGTCSPRRRGSHGPLPQRWLQGVRGRRTGRPRGPPRTRGRPQRRTEPGAGDGARTPSAGTPGAAAAAGRGRRGRGAGPGSPSSRRTANAERPACSFARDRCASHLSRALPGWLCGIAS